MLSATCLWGDGTGEIIGIHVEESLCAAASLVSRSSVADTATAVRLVPLLYGPSSPEIERLLYADSRLPEFLSASYAPLSTSFEPGVRFSVYLFRDPEADVEPVIVVRIHTSMSVGEALSRLDEFDAAWYLEHDPAITSRVNFQLQFA